MMQGEVSRTLESIVRITLIGVNNREVEVDAGIDTGYTGHLTLPIAMLQSFGWPLDDEETVELGDATEVAMLIYRGIVNWHGNSRLVDVVAAASTPLIGADMLRGSELKVEFKPGGKISISPLP